MILLKYIALITYDTFFNVSYFLVENLKSLIHDTSLQGALCYICFPVWEDALSVWNVFLLSDMVEEQCGDPQQRFLRGEGRGRQAQSGDKAAQAQQRRLVQCHGR